MLLNPKLSELFWKIMYYLEDMSVEERYNLYIGIASILWMIYVIYKVNKKPKKKYDKPVATYRKISKREMKKRLSKQNFRADGSYYDKKRNVWVNEADFKEINTIPEDYYWDDIECRWLPPNHPDHPRFHMNDRDLFNDD